ncbi:MAG TPA: LysR family transcriptional regulator [Cryobacterium sp.]|nr:LysR family transcriptional regulator [Cryobacterium sp.]
MFGTRLPDLVALRMLVAVGETGSLTSASVALAVSQQAVSARMRTLEGQLGTALVARSPRGSTLTENGRLVAGWAREVLEAADRLAAAVDTLRAGAAAHLHVAASLTIAEHLLPRWLIAFREGQARPGQARPGRAREGQVTTVHLTATNSASVIDLVRSGSHALGFVETPDIPTDLQSLVIASDELVLVVAPGHPWARRRSGISAAELAATPLISREAGSGTRRSLEHTLAQLPRPLAMIEPAAELPTTAAIRATVVAGRVPAVLSALAVGDDVASGRLVAVRLTDVRLVRPLTAIWRAAVRAHPNAALPDAALDLLAVAHAAGPSDRRSLAT